MSVACQHVVFFLAQACGSLSPNSAFLLRARQKQALASKCAEVSTRKWDIPKKELHKSLHVPL